MKRHGSLIIIAAAAIGFFISACSEQKPTAEKVTPERAKIENLATTPQDIKKEAKDLAKTTMAYTEEQKDLYMEKLKEKMAQYNRNLVEYRAKLAMMNEQAKADLAEEIDNLSSKKVEMESKIRELQAASGEAFEDLKDGLDNAMDEMDKAYEQAMKRFDK